MMSVTASVVVCDRSMRGCRVSELVIGERGGANDRQWLVISSTNGRYGTRINRLTCLAVCPRRHVVQAEAAFACVPLLPASRSMQVPNPAAVPAHVPHPTNGNGYRCVVVTATLQRRMCATVVAGCAADASIFGRPPSQACG